MEAEIILSFLPRLITAVCDNVMSVSDQCLAKGLINETVYKRVLESGGTSEDKARTLILAVKKSTETDSRCFELFVSILDEALPSIPKNSLLLSMKDKFIARSNELDLEVVPVRDCGPGAVSSSSREIVKQQTTLFHRLEDAIRQHEHACAEKVLLEDSVQSKEDENVQLKSELDNLSRVMDSALNGTKIEDTESRISACEAEMSTLKGRIEELESIIEEQGMQVKRGRNIMTLGMMNLMGQLSFLTKKEVEEVQQLDVKKEADYLAALRDKETQHRMVLEEKEEELMAVKTKVAEKEKLRSEALKDMDEQLLTAQRENQKLDGSVQELKMKSLHHEIDLKDKDLKIKELELEIARHQQGASGGSQKKFSGLTSWIKSKR